MAAPPELQALVDAIPSGSSSEAGSGDDRTQSPRRIADERSRKRPHSQSADGQTAKRHKRRKRDKQSRSHRAAATTLAQDDFEKGLQNEIEYAQSSRHQRTSQPWYTDRLHSEAEPDCELYELIRAGDTHNLSFGNAYRSEAPSYRRTAWAGLSKAPATFAAMLFHRVSRMRAAFGDLSAADVQPPAHKRRYYAKKRGFGGRRIGAAAQTSDIGHASATCLA